MADYRSSELWQLTLKARPDDPFEAYRERLRVAYDIFWERGIALAQRISAELPGLTLHDESHLSALWDRASQLTGQHYQINPLEAFVFGGAVLLHDAGHAIAAYEGGLPELKRTVEYRDAVAGILRMRGANPPHQRDIANPPDATAKAAIFTTLRRLHAKQAEVLATRAFKGKYLIDDTELRDNLAPLIGRVAASHHWARTSLDEKLWPNLQGAPGFMPQDWPVQAVKLACLLRCSDAIQIDQRRAPAFAFAIHDPEGESALHWLAQQLAQPVVICDPGGGPGRLLFTSQTDFTEDRADAWWIAHDFVSIANDELQGCYQIMKDMSLQSLTVDRVMGIESPHQLERYIRTTGWRPVTAQVRVTSVEQIIRLFGGQILYGRDPRVPLRELVQNGSDAVRARRALAKDAFYEGKVVVSLNPDAEEGFWRLVVEDDGIGMSDSILTGPLIEFGKSLWTSEDAQDEFPGLLSASLHQIGRYGIGFFSTLMIAERIAVTSRRWDAGHDQAHKLTFRKGLRLRPLLSDASLSQFSTRVELHITSSDVEQLTTAYPRFAQENFKVSLKELIAHLCPCLDCDVFVSQGEGQFDLAHSRKWYQSDALKWTREIVFAEPKNDQVLNNYLAKIAPLARVIEGPDGPCGRAAIAFGNIETGIESVGGLASSTHSRMSNFSMQYVGAIGFEPGGPRRNAGCLLGDNVGAWATEQAQLLTQFEISDMEKYLAAVNAANFGGDPTPIAMVLINRRPTTLSTVYDLLQDGTTIYAPIEHSGGLVEISRVYHSTSPGIKSALAWNELDFGVTTMEAWPGGHIPDKAYHRIPTEETPMPSCFLSCLQRYAYSKRRTLQWELESDVLFARYKGEASAREKLLPGLELRATGLKLSLISPGIRTAEIC